MSEEKPAKMASEASDSSVAAMPTQETQERQQHDVDAEKTTAPEAGPTGRYVHGLRLYSIAYTLATMIFLVVLEIPIVPTALVPISNDLGGFNDLSWVISSYLLGRVGVMVILAKLSDIFGRKLIFTMSIAVFVIFSGICGASQTLTQLIVFRAIQGVGGGGAYSLSTVLISELVAPENLAKALAQLSLLTTLANTLGPIIGGAISKDTSWRWIFIINSPIAASALIIALVAIPRGFGKANRQSKQSGKDDPSWKHSLSRIDALGNILILFATLSLVAGFEEAGSKFPWKSAYVISLLTISGLLWIALGIWEHRVTLSEGKQEPILPWRFFTNRAMISILSIFFLLGGPLVVTIYQIPQVFQLVYRFTYLDAGIRVVPFTALWSVGLIVGPTLTRKFKIPPIYIILTGSVIQVIGFALLATLPVSLTTPPQIYGYEVIAGLGCGLVFPLLFAMIPFVTEGRDRAVGMAMGGQFQVMGSAVLLSIATSVFNGYTQPRLKSVLEGYGPGSLLNLGQTLSSLPVDQQNEIRLVLAKGYNQQSLVLSVAAAIQIPFGLLLWRREQIKVSK
ncbi:putative multidrug resistance protein fnx1 [Xylaria digitata]|nr:putative multidrug resistance protein fnx1 [Xylaria digitata]